MALVRFNVSDLESFGIILLTGEACGLGMRILADLTEQGVDIWRLFTRSEPIGEAWNSKGIKSIMIPRNMLEELWVFCHIQSDSSYVFKGGCITKKDFVTKIYGDTSFEFPTSEWSNTQSVYVIENDEYVKEIWEDIKQDIEEKYFYISKIYKAPSNTNTIDNTHSMSGRTL